MAQRKAATKSANKSAKKATGKKSDTFTAEERAAMKEYIAERKAARGGKVDGEADLLAKVAKMAASDRAMAEKVHAIVKASAPELEPKTWYGMPAYAKDGKVVCFFQDAAKFKARYATLGFQDSATLDDGAIWPVAYALTKIGPTEEAKIKALVKKAMR